MKPEIIMSDLELGAMNAFKKIFPHEQLDNAWNLLLSH